VYRPSVDPDLVLLERWRSGDQKAGQDLFTRHLESVYRFFENKVGADAEELVQGTFLACVRSRDQFRGQSSFRTFLFAIARHELYGYFRRASHDDRFDAEVTSIEQVVTSIGGRVDRARRADQLRAALLQLPADQQLLLELHYWHDLDAAGLAEVFESTAGAIRVRLLRARRALRDVMTASAPAALSNAADRMTSSLSEPELDEAADRA
jgi:RNA polymerase sigma factor (sigma-70 family)